jgi:hypothetical protein
MLIRREDEDAKRPQAIDDLPSDAAEPNNAHRFSIQRRMNAHWICRTAMQRFDDLADLSRGSEKKKDRKLGD